jgi:hypothetical protein
MSQQQFDEDWIDEGPADALDRRRPVDPIDGRGHIDPDWDAIDTAIDGIAPSDLQQLGDALRIILKALLANPRNHPFARMSPVYAVRLIALGWVLMPDHFGSCTLRDLARTLRIHHKVLEWHAQRATKTFGIMNRRQRAAKGWGKNAEARN